MFLLSVAAIWTVAAITPGPDFFIVVKTALEGLRSAAVAVFVASLFAATLPAEHSWMQGAAAVATMVLVSSLWYTFVLTVPRNPVVAGAYARGRKALDAAAGVIFMGFGLKLLTSAW